MFKRIITWWKGPYIPMRHEGNACVDGGYHQRPRLATAIENVLRYLGRHWLAIAALLIALIALFK